jgi:hypothetical protein
VIFLNRIVLPICLIVCGPSLALEAVCDYKDTITVTTIGKIIKTRNFHSESVNYFEDNRICVVKFDANVGGDWHQAHGTYVFGPGLTENYACAKATERAKVAVLEQLVPQEVNNTTVSECKEISEVINTKATASEPIIVKKIVEKKVYVEREIFIDRMTEKRFERNPYSNSFECWMLTLFAPYPYHNKKCDSYIEISDNRHTRGSCKQWYKEEKVAGKMIVTRHGEVCP